MCGGWLGDFVESSWLRLMLQRTGKDRIGWACAFVVVEGRNQARTVEPKCIQMP